MGIAPAFAMPKALARAGLAPEDIDVWEVHEAYASVAVAILRELPNQLDGFEVPDDHLNPNGGAVAIGHPFGSSGTRYVLTSRPSCASEACGTGSSASASVPVRESRWRSRTRPP